MPRLTVDDYEALANFRYLLRKFLRFSKDFLRANGNLSPEQYESSLAIRAFTSIGGLTISQLSERLQVKHHSAVNNCRSLGRKKIDYARARRDGPPTATRGTCRQRREL